MSKGAAECATIDHTPCIHTQVMNIISPFGFLMNRTDRKQGGVNLSFAVSMQFRTQIRGL